MKIACTLGLVLTLAPTLAAQEKVVDTTLSAVRATPDAYRDVWIRFNVQFASVGKIKNPFFTQFVPSKYANFYTWADEQKIWKQTEYEDLFGLLFLDKSSRRLADLYNTKVYQRLQIIGVVRNVFQGKPWIEVSDFSYLSQQLNTTTLSHIYRGETLMEQRKWKQAIAELSLAPGDNLPNHVVGEIHKDLALCYLRLGESDTAVDHIETAVELKEGLDYEIRQLARMAKRKPESFLDRTLDTMQVEDHERPMWEAFEDPDQAGS